MSFEIITLQNANGFKISLSRFGATWLSCQLPLKKPREVLLGCKIGDLPTQKIYLGATLGRYANRIADGKFILNGREHQVSLNHKDTQAIHGGVDNFSYRIWEITQQSDNQVTFQISSPDGDQGFNGNLIASVTYTLTQNSVVIDYEATCDQISVCSMSNHAYFNLDGDNSSEGVREHLLMLPSRYFLPIDEEGIPTADLQSVENTPFDFHQDKTIMQDFHSVLDYPAPTIGYDHDWYYGNDGQDKLMCQVLSADRKVGMTLHSTHPSLHVYTGNFLIGTPNRKGENYDDFDGMSLTPGCLANSPNLPDYINDTLISPNKPYQQRSVYRFEWE